MYGGKKPNLDEYKIVKIYDNNMNIIDNIYSKRELIEILSIRNNKDILLTLIPDEEIDEILNGIDIPNDEKEIKETINKIVCNNELKYILMNIIDKSRADNYDDWLRIGFCLFNISHKNLELWIEFSRRSIKYKKGECEKIWKKMKTPIKPILIGTLYFFA